MREVLASNAPAHAFPGGFFDDFGQLEAHQAEACIPVGECWIEGLPGDLPRGSPVQVRCGVAANGRIEVMALDMTSGRMATAEIHRPGGLTDAEVAREAAWVRGLKIQ